MKCFAFLFLLLSSITSLYAGIEEDLAELFAGHSSPGTFYQNKARALLEKVTDEPLRKLAIQISKFAFPEINHCRVDTLHYLLKERSLNSISELQVVFSLFNEKKESYCGLAYLPRLEKLKSLVQEAFPLIAQKNNRSPLCKVQDIYGNLFPDWSPELYTPPSFSPDPSLPQENFSLKRQKLAEETKISIESLAVECKANILSVLDQSNQGLELESDAPYTECALKVIHTFEKALKRKQKNNSAMPYLESDGDEIPLPLFVGLANSFRESGKDLKSNDALPIWGLLANAYLKVALEAFTTSEQFREAQEYFAPELIRRTQEKKATYEWFTLFTDRLSILMTPPGEREIAPPFNTRIADYKVALTTFQFKNQPGWYTHKGYKSACQTIGAKYTQNVFSPLALSRELFPDIVMLPYPFELSEGDILRTMPRPGGSHLWALGYALDKVWADGGLLTPSILKEHDKGHLAEVIWCLSAAPYLFVNNEDHIVPSMESAWHRNKEGRQLYYAALKRVQEMASANRDDDQMRMNTFLGFLVFHEGASTLEHRIFSLVSGYNRIVSSASFINLKDPHYYLDLLPDSLKRLTGNYCQFIDAYSEYVKQFLKEFAEQDHDYPLIESIRKWVASGEPTFDTASYQDRKKIDFYSIKTIDFGHESQKNLGYTTQSMQNNIETYVQLPDDAPRRAMLTTLRRQKEGSTYQRYYFLGSPFYQGEEPPKLVKETLGF